MYYSRLFLLFASDQDLYPSDDNELMLVECPAVILIFIITAMPCMYIWESVSVWESLSFSSHCILRWVCVPKNVHIILIVLTLMHIIYLIFYLSVCLSLDKLSESRSIGVSSDDLMCVYLCCLKWRRNGASGRISNNSQHYCKQNNQS